MSFSHLQNNQGVNQTTRQTARQAGWQNLSAAAVKTKLEQNPDIRLVDVRTSEEYREGHIPGSILLPLDRLTTEAEETLPDKNAEMIVYCRSGNRSATASQSLTEMGYTNVANLTGGIMDWPYQVERQ
ncbi:MAG TPA: rhodanese-like domain-containing protein [Bacillota bacterium]|nr:rhodanese-like domain-containing protein [Bacillota bacterium]